MDKFVVDTGPFIHLEQIGQLRLLKKLPYLFIPISVAREIKQDTANPGMKNIKNWSNIKIVSTSRKITDSIKTIIEKASLQLAETDCIYLALKLSPCIFLTDDLAARTAAEKLSIETHGSVGIIAYAFKRKWLSLKMTERALNLLYERSNLFITYAIIEEALRRLRDSV